MQSVQIKSTTNAPKSATQQTFIDQSPDNPAAPVSAAATPEIRTASVYAYFGSGVGYRVVRVAIQERPDATVIAMILPCGETARVWAYPHGVGVQVQSKSHANRWYNVTSRHCECPRFHFQHHCTHRDIAADEALAVWERYSAYTATEGQVA